MRRLLISTVLALSVATVAGCSMAGSSDSQSLPDAPASQEGGTSSSAGELGSAAEDTGQERTVGGQQVITTAHLTVAVDDPVESADEASRIAGRLGGFVEERTEHNSDTSQTQIGPQPRAGSAQLRLRIPSADLTVALTQLKELGDPRSTTINSTDVTAQARDLDARITALRTSVDRLLALMEKATSTENLLAIETALSERQASLESLESQKRHLDNQVQLSTVSLYLISHEDAPAQTPDTFWSGLIAGWNGFVTFWSLALVTLGVVAPWLVTGGIVAAVVVLWVKAARRRK